jgi:hypothetical protein
MSTSPVSPEDIRAAAEVHQELGPEYSDAVVASFLNKVDREVAARVKARLAGEPQAGSANQQRRRTLLTGVVIGAAVSGTPLVLVATRARQAAGQIAVSPGGQAVHVVSRSQNAGWLLLWLVVVAICAVAAVRVRRQPRGPRLRGR